MRVLITGSRDWTDEEAIYRALAAHTGFEHNVTLLSGHCPTGADAIAERYAKTKGWDIELHPADWGKYGKYAGPKRNQEMVDRKPDLVLAFILNGSKGASGTVAMAKKAGLRVHVVEANSEE